MKKLVFVILLVSIASCVYSQPTLMRKSDDCEIAAISTATGKSYEEVAKKLNKQALPFGLSDPIWSNPDSLYLLVSKLGYWKRNVTLSMLKLRQATPGKTIILVHNPQRPTLSQHWVCLESYRGEGGYNVWWGIAKYAGHNPMNPAFVSETEMESLYRKGSPNCAFEIVNDTAWSRFKRWLGC